MTKFKMISKTDAEEAAAEQSSKHNSELAELLEYEYITKEDDPLGPGVVIKRYREKPRDDDGLGQYNDTWAEVVKKINEEEVNE